MTVIDLDEKQGTWFDMEGGGRVQLRTIDPEDWLKVRKATIKKVPFVQKVDGVPMVFNQEILDEDMQMVMTHDMSIVSWEKLFDKKNNPIPCTSENKRRLMLKVDSFRNFVNEKLELLRKAESVTTEQVEKNL